MLWGRTPHAQRQLLLRASVCASECLRVSVRVCISRRVSAHVCVCDLRCIVSKILNSGLLIGFLYNSVTYLITTICLTLLKSLYSLIMTNSILKSINIIFSTTVHIVKSMVFPVVIIRYESWTIKKAEH